MTALTKDPEALYNRLFGDEDARVCKDIPQESCKDQPRNFFVHTISLSLTKLGDKLVDPKITLAWLLTALGAPGIYLTLLVPIRDAVALLPQLVIAAFIRRSPLRKWWWVAGSVGQALALLVICIAALFLTGHEAGLMIITALVGFSAARGVCSVAHKDVLGKTVSKTRRGRVGGISETVAGFMTVIFAVALLLTEDRNLQLIVMLIAIAALLWMLSAALFAGVEEQPGATEGGANALNEALGQFSLLWSNAEFGHFVLVRAALLGSALSAPYLVVLASGEEDGSVQLLAVLLLAASLAGFVSGSVWGKLADQSSSRCMFVAGNLSGAAGVAAIVFALLEVGRDFLFALCLFTLYLGHAGVRIGRKTHLVDMADSDNRASLVAVSNTTIGLLLLVMAGLGMLAFSLHPYGGLILFSTLALAGAWMSRGLREVQS